MSRFFKSAAFPILIVVVLAFFAQRLISPGHTTPTPHFNQFLTQIQQGQVKSVDIQTKDNTVQVTPIQGDKYAVGYPSDYGNSLINQLQTAPNHPQFDVEGTKSSAWPR